MNEKENKELRIITQERTSHNIAFGFTFAMCDVYTIYIHYGYIMGICRERVAQTLARE